MIDRADHIRKVKEESKKEKPKKVYQIPKVSKKRQKQMGENKELLKLDEEFYKDMWQAWPHRCFECNASLGRQPYNWMIHHLLEKHLYPEFRHVPENIVLLCLQCHDQAHRMSGRLPKTEKRAREVEKLLMP